jgi:hypothetical protein
MLSFSPPWKTAVRPVAARSGLRRRPVRLEIEALERRDVPVATVSGTVFQALDLAGMFPAPTTLPPANPTPTDGFFAPLANVQVTLTDQGGMQMQNSGMDGTFTFNAVTAGSVTVQVTLPAGYLGFSSQSLSYALTIADGATFANLNFALTPKNQALVQNLSELVLNSPAELDPFNQQVSQLDAGASAGVVFRGILQSADFQTVDRPIALMLQAFLPGPLDVGLYRHAGQLQNLQVSQDAVVLDILYSQTFVDRFGDTSAKTDGQFVNFVYQQLLNRNPTAQERSSAVQKLQDPTYNRGQLILDVLALPAFTRRRPGVPRQAIVSLAYLGILGREATLDEFRARVRQMGNGLTARVLADRLSNSTEFQQMTGFTDTFIWDVAANQIKPSIALLDRLQVYNRETKQFDMAVTPQSIASTNVSPTNVYLIAHGWAPGYLEDVLLLSTPGDPLMSWDTQNFPPGGSPGPEPAWLYNGVKQVSYVGLATAIAEADPNAVVVAYSWVDESATSLDPPLIDVDLTSTFGASQTTVTVGDTSQLTVGLSVTGPGIAAGTTISSILNATQVTLSQNTTAPGTGVSLNFAGVDIAEGLRQFLYAGQSESFTQLNGLQMAEALQQALAGSFYHNQGLVHILGHSHGSKVATVATLAMQKAGLPVSQLTLFESPEGGPDVGTLLSPNPLHAPGLAGAQNFLWYYLQQMNLSRDPVQVVGDVRGPAAPNMQGLYPTFVDNYYSEDGFGSALGGYPGPGLGSIVDVKMHPEDLYGQFNLTNPTGAGATLFGSHSYPPPWYAQASLQPPFQQENGLSWSPLLDPAKAQTLDEFYEQQQQNTPEAFVLTQFQLNGTTRPTSVEYTPTFTPLSYARQYEVGQVMDTGSGLQLGVNTATPEAISAITFTPLGQTLDGMNSIQGTGMDFQFQFSGVQPGEQPARFDPGAGSDQGLREPAAVHNGCPGRGHQRPVCDHQPGQLPVLRRLRQRPVRRHHRAQWPGTKRGDPRLLAGDLQRQHGERHGQQHAPVQ